MGCDISIGRSFESLMNRENTPPIYTPVQYYPFDNLGSVVHVVGYSFAIPNLVRRSSL